MICPGQGWIIEEIWLRNFFFALIYPRSRQATTGGIRSLPPHFLPRAFQVGRVSCELPIHLISPIGHEGCLSGLLVLSHRARFAGHYHRFPISTRFCTLQLSRRIGFLRGPSARIERAAAHSTDPWLVCLTSLSVRSGVSRLVSLSLGVPLNGTSVFCEFIEVVNLRRVKLWRSDCTFKVVRVKTGQEFLPTLYYRASKDAFLFAGEAKIIDRWNPANKDPGYPAHKDAGFHVKTGSPVYKNVLINRETTIGLKFTL